MATKKQKGETTGDAFRDRLGADHPEAWKPEDGGMIVGKIVDFQRGHSNHPKLRGPYPIAIVQPEDGDDLVSVHILPAVLRRGFERENPVIGDRIGIQYRGERESKTGGGEYHDYRVRVDRATAEKPASFADVAGGVWYEPTDDAEPDADADGDGLPF